MSEGQKVELPENLTIAVAEELHQMLEPLVSGEKDIVMDGAAVSRVDTAGLQLLYSFLQALSSTSARVTWEGASETLLEASQKLGLREHLAL